jgi:hypothetical protein
MSLAFLHAPIIIATLFLAGCSTQPMMVYE